MINEQNYHFYLRWLVQLSNSQPIRYNEIPKIFQDFFSLPALSQTLNISNENPPSADWSNIENYIINNSFTDFDSLSQGIIDNFQTDFDKLYAAYYFITHNIQFDWDRYISNDRQPLSIEELFKTKKGTSADYSNLLIELAKSTGINSDNIQLLPFPNTYKGDDWNSYNPPPNAEPNHESVFIDIHGDKYVSEPTLGAGFLDDDHQFNYQYKKFNFLIPYHNALLLHYPETATDDFTWNQFTSLNEPNFEKDLSYESAPFQRITVENGFYQMQFSFLQPVESIYAEMTFLVKQETDEWAVKDEEFVSLRCLAKDLPNRSCSLTNELRCRYKMTVSFPEVGSYEVKVILNDSQLFKVYFDVKSLNEKSTFGIPESLKEKNGFIPIVPTDELSVISDGYARIRFAVNLNNSAVVVKLFKLKEGTFERETGKTVENCSRFFVVNLPFEFDESENMNGYLVEDWVLVEFPEDGRWEVRIFFDSEMSESDIFGLGYFFDVTGTCVHNVFPIFDLPNNRTFAPLQTKKPGEVWIEPSTQSVVLNSYDLSFHVFSENEVKISIKHENDEAEIAPTLVGEKEASEGASVKDREYSVTFPEDGSYILELWDADECIAAQNYYVGEIELKEETQEGSEAMNVLKTTITMQNDYCSDIPDSIKTEVTNLIQQNTQNENTQDQEQETNQEQNQDEVQNKLQNEQLNVLEQNVAMLNNLIGDNNNDNDNVGGDAGVGVGDGAENEPANDPEMLDVQFQIAEPDSPRNQLDQTDDFRQTKRSRATFSLPGSPRSSTARSTTRPPLKKRPIKTKPPVLYTPPIYKTVEVTPELQALKEKAKREDPLVNVSSDVLEDLLYILNQEKKSYAKDHLYKNGLKCNNMIAHVTKYYELAKRKENQEAARREFTEVNKQFEDSLQQFDAETKKLEKELLGKQEEKRNALKNTLDEQLGEFDEKWNSERKQRTYNHSTNNLNSLRSKLSFLLVEGRFKDAEEVQKQVNERTQYEQTSHSEIMKSDHDTSLRFLRDKQSDEIETFEKNCQVELEKFRQDRVKLRQSYVNRQLKLRTKEEIIADPNKLWMHGQTERMGNTLKNSLSRGVTINSSSKMKRADIKERDAVTLVLPPLESSRKSPRKTAKKKEKEDEE